MLAPENADLFHLAAGFENTPPRSGFSAPLGLLPEDYDTDAQRMWGNFPQTYSHVGLIHAAFAASPRWMEVL
ncbi:MAG: glycoside hydrolase family 15 protein [Bryobacteraceae bacterium]